MTQKELLYYEDGVGHEGNIIKILNSSLDNCESEEIRIFLENEIKIHEKLKENLISLLEEKVNE